MLQVKVGNNQQVGPLMKSGVGKVATESLFRSIRVPPPPKPLPELKATETTKADKNQAET